MTNGQVKLHFGISGYALALDMTARDLQAAAKVSFQFPLASGKQQVSSLISHHLHKLF